MIKEVEIPATKVEKVVTHKLLVVLGMAPTSGRAKRLVKQRAVSINGVKVGDIAELKDGDIVKCGWKFIRVQLPVETISLKVDVEGDRAAILDIKGA